MIWKGKYGISTGYLELKKPHELKVKLTKPNNVKMSIC